MIGFYSRVSSVSQKSDRQLVNTADMTVLEDKCSGSIAFEDRPAGKRVIQALENGELESLVVHSLDRLGRDLLNILQTIQTFNEAGICIEIRNEGLRTLDLNGKPNPTAKMVISILGVLAEMNLSQIRENQATGIALAKTRGQYLGRRVGSVESRKRFLSKSRTQKVIGYLEKGYKGTEIQQIMGVSPNTISKVRRMVSIPVK
jgi:DNA invertase Pin-like site-specific DNA recombinase